MRGFNAAPGGCHQDTARRALLRLEAGPAFHLPFDRPAAGVPRSSRQPPGQHVGRIVDAQGQPAEPDEHGREIATAMQ